MLAAVQRLFATDVLLVFIGLLHLMELFNYVCVGLKRELVEHSGGGHSCVFGGRPDGTFLAV